MLATDAGVHDDRQRWIQGLLARRPRTVVAVALANKTARIAWAVLARGAPYRIAAAA